MTNIESAKLDIENGRYRNSHVYKDAMMQMRFEPFSQNDVNFFITHYKATKDIFSRSQILAAFVLRCLKFDLKEFFLLAFKKERYLDMKLTAIRGYAAYATEEEVIPLMKKFIELLIKRPIHTPYNYQEYELLRSKFGLPYLISQYNYDCFIEAFAQLERQYNAMPDLCKGFFTLDENGLLISLMAPE